MSMTATFNEMHGVDAILDGRALPFDRCPPN